MRALASYIMRGRSQAIVVAIVATCLTLILPPTSLLAGGVVALVTLRNGASEGALVMAASAAIVAVFAAVGLQQPMLALSLGLVLLTTVLPVWLLSAVLRSTRSLALTATAALSLGALVVGLFYIATGGTPEVWWKQHFAEMLTGYREALLQAAEENPAALDTAQVDRVTEALGRFFPMLANWMTGVLAAALMTGFMTSVVLGRWWQAMLYNPGGLRQEVFNLRLGKSVGVLAAVIGVCTFAPGVAANFASDLLWVFGAIFLLPGVAIVHVWLTGKRYRTPGLVLFYVLLAIIPHVALLLAALGWVDTWMNFRARFSSVS